MIFYNNKKPEVYNISQSHQDWATACTLARVIAVLPYRRTGFLRCRNSYVMLMTTQTVTYLLLGRL